MKIGILGGSFDPPHLGHILIAQQVIELTDIDQVWLMPNYTTATHHKVFQKKLSPIKNRVAMAELLGDEKIKVSDFEIKKNKKSLTIITLQTLSQQYPQHTFYWITGSDKLETFHLYDEWYKIISDYHLIIFPRGELQTDLKEHVKSSLGLQTIPENVIVLDNNELLVTNISSTIVRERIKKGLQIDFLVPQKVEEYIKKNKLYE